MKIQTLKCRVPFYIFAISRLFFCTYFLPSTFFLLLFGCATSSKSELKLSESQEYYTGRAVAANALTQLKLYKDDNLQDYVTKIGYSIALESNRPEMFEGYNFAVIDDPSVNAFSFPGGFIFITTGAIKSAQNEDELAAILAHEIAHVNLRHPEVATLNELKKKETAETLSFLASTAMKISNELRKDKGKEGNYSEEEIKNLSNTLGDVAGSLGNIVVKGYDRDQELEADSLGIELAARTGYNPISMVNYLERLKDKKSGGWLNDSHPSPKERINKLDEVIKNNNLQLKDITQRVNRFQKYTAALKSQQ